MSAKWGFVGRNLYEGVNSVAKLPKSDGHGNDNGVGPPPEQGNSHLFRPMKKIVGTWKTAENNRNFEMEGRRTVFDSDVPFEMEKKENRQHTAELRQRIEKLEGLWGIPTSVLPSYGIEFVTWTIITIIEKNSQQDFHEDSPRFASPYYDCPSYRDCQSTRNRQDRH